MPRLVIRKPPACAVDDRLFDRMADAARLTLGAADREMLRLAIEFWNGLPVRQAEYRRAHGLPLTGRKEDGRPKSVNLHTLVHSLLMVFENAGGRVTATKAENGRVCGPAAEFLRVAFEGINFHGRKITKDGFARLVIEAWRQPKSRARRAWQDYNERIRNAWKNPD